MPMNRKLRKPGRAGIAGAGAGPGGGGGVKPQRTPVTATEEKTSLDRPWNVVVWNDPITLMSYVVYVFQKLFGYNSGKATRLMLEVHHQGRSIVTTADRERAEHYVSLLHGFGLQATLERTL